MTDLLSLPPELLLGIREWLVLIEAEELKKDVQLRAQMRYPKNRPTGPCRTAYRAHSMLARTCHKLKSVARMDTFNKHTIWLSHALWLFDRPIAAFTRQFLLDKTWHNKILPDEYTLDETKYRGRARDDIE
jgi:hypothetical protein